MAGDKDHGTDPLLFNKIAAGLLAAGLIAMVTGLIADALVSPHPLEQDAFAVEAAEDTAAPAGGATAAPTEIAPIAPLLAAADLKAGEASAKKCLTCHTFEKGGANKIGPNLWSVVGNHKAHLGDGFAYSPAILARKAETWDFENLNKFIASPAGYMKGTKMSFAGIRNEKERANVIAWLRTLSDSPVPLP